MKKITWINIAIVILCIALLYTSYGVYRATVLYNDEYCCRHMARDLEEQFERYGFNVDIVIGENKFKDSSHAWVRINGLEIDSVTLYPAYFPALYENITYYESYYDYLLDEPIGVYETRNNIIMELYI